MEIVKQAELLTNFMQGHDITWGPWVCPKPDAMDEVIWRDIEAHNKRRTLLSIIGSVPKERLPEEITREVRRLCFAGRHEDAVVFLVPDKSTPGLSPVWSYFMQKDAMAPLLNISVKVLNERIKDGTYRVESPSPRRHRIDMNTVPQMLRDGFKLA